MEELHVRHRKEQRDLQSRIAQKKKSATRKTRNGVNDECEALQRELTDGHQAEIACLAGEVSVNGIDNLQINDNDDPTAVPSTQPERESNSTQEQENQAAENSGPHIPQPPAKKPNRQKARLARRAAEQEAQAAQAAEEAANLPDLRGKEREIMLERFKKLGLKEREIQPDGHCLYSAVSSSLGDIGVGLTPNMEPAVSANGKQEEGFRLVRSAAAQFIEEHPDDFAPFLEEPLDFYTHKIRATTEWGGQLELQAIARAYGVEINVVQGDGRIEKIESNGDDEDKKIWLAYYRHNFGLGEHYNALRRAT